MDIEEYSRPQGPAESLSVLILKTQRQPETNHNINGVGAPDPSQGTTNAGSGEYQQSGMHFTGSHASTQEDKPQTVQPR